jgi:DNA-binding protein HU-beta
MNTADPIAKLAEQNGLPKSQVKTLVDELLKEIVVSASEGDEISLPGFGKFKVKETVAWDTACWAFRPLAKSRSS